MSKARWTGSDDYEAYVGRWSRHVAARFVDRLAIPPGARWLDVGCGTGALTVAILDRGDPGSVIGIDPSEDFVDRAASTVVDPRVRFVVGDGAALPLEDGSVDVVVSGLVLNHVANATDLLREMGRVAAAGGTVAAYVWDYAGRMDMIRRFWDAAISLDPGAAALDQGVRSPICSPGALLDAFEEVGFTAVDVHPIDVPTTFRDFDDYWSPFLSGVGPAPGYTVSRPPDVQAALRERLEATLPTDADGSIKLIARAWAVQGRKP